LFARSTTTASSGLLRLDGLDQHIDLLTGQQVLDTMGGLEFGKKIIRIY
jgi:hypothetical protein